jgi:hypothetical protein
MRRRDDRYYVTSAIATLVFYAGVLAACAAAGLVLGFLAIAGLAVLLAWLYRGRLFGLWRWPAPLDIDALIRRERARATEPRETAKP